MTAFMVSFNNSFLFFGVCILVSLTILPFRSLFLFCLFEGCSYSEILSLISLVLLLSLLLIDHAPWPKWIGFRLEVESHIQPPTRC